MCCLGEYDPRNMDKVNSGELLQLRGTGDAEERVLKCPVALPSLMEPAWMSQVSLQWPTLCMGV